MIEMFIIVQNTILCTSLQSISYIINVCQLFLTVNTWESEISFYYILGRLIHYYYPGSNFFFTEIRNTETFSLAHLIENYFFFFKCGAILKP